jgi:Tfp pilus assembly protein PilE
MDGDFGSSPKLPVKVDRSFLTPMSDGPRNAASCQIAGAKNCHLKRKSADNPRSIDHQRGFSLVQVMVVVVVVAAIAFVGIPHLQKAFRASDDKNAITAMRSIAGAQVEFYSKYGRFGRLYEINSSLMGSIGKPVGNGIARGKYLLSMSPDLPSEGELKNGYTIMATRNPDGDGGPYVYELTERGEIRQILP